MKECTIVGIICGKRISQTLYYQHKKFNSVQTKTWISSFEDDFKQQQDDFCFPLNAEFALSPVSHSKVSIGDPLSSCIFVLATTRYNLCF